MHRITYKAGGRDLHTVYARILSDQDKTLTILVNDEVQIEVKKTRIVESLKVD